MSRAYRVQVSETAQRRVRAEDHVSTTLPLLQLLPPEQLAGLLATELEKQGFAREGESLVRQDGNVTVQVNPATAEVRVSSAVETEVALESQRSGHYVDDYGPRQDEIEARLRQQAQEDLTRQAAAQERALQQKVSQQLEGHLDNLQQELNQVVNRTTAAALKIRAAQLGEIKEVTEDTATGSLTIVVEV